MFRPEKNNNIDSQTDFREKKKLVGGLIFYIIPGPSSEEVNQSKTR